MKRYAHAAPTLDLFAAASAPVASEASHLRSYTLRCTRCGWSGYDSGYQLYCPTCGPDAFLRTEYRQPPTEVNGDGKYFYDYAAWLPTTTRFDEQGPLIGCTRAVQLGEAIGLSNLWLLISCYAPELDADFRTGTFKEVEALGVLARVKEQTDKLLIVSSAGNAGRAFLEIGARYDQPAIVVVPDAAMTSMAVSKLAGEIGPILIVLEDAYYPDAIRFVAEVQDRFSGRLVREGGCYNVARRDAIGVLMHRVMRTLGCVPEHYVQAVGSGTGAIAAWEAVMRSSSTDGGPAMKLHLVQNAPFAPMADAWQAGHRHVEPMNHDEVHRLLSQTYANVLSNATPPYATSGGVYDALTDTDGMMYKATNEEAIEAGHLFHEHTGIVPCAEAAVAVAGLLQSVRQGELAADDCVLLHVTGGGWDRVVCEYGKKLYQPECVLKPDDIGTAAEVIERYLDRVQSTMPAGGQ